MTQIVVIGKSGQLASELRELDGSLVCLGRDDIDLLDAKNMGRKLNSLNLNAIINASAYTQVDKAESDETSAFALNHIAVANLAGYCANNNIHCTHVSTDYVFAGNKGSPYLYNDPLAPIGVYGESKAKGELELEQKLPKLSCIIRTSWVYSQFGNNFVKTMLRLMNEKSEIDIIDDQIGSPTSAKALAATCLYAARNRVSGIHHFTDAGVASWYDFAIAIQSIGSEYGMLKQTIPIRPIPTSAYPTPAKRPSYSVLDKSTLSSAFNFLQPKHWREELESVIKQLALVNGKKIDNE